MKSASNLSSTIDLVKIYARYKASLQRLKYRATYRNQGVHVRVLHHPVNRLK